MGKFESKFTILTKKINNQLFEILPKTHSDMVYVDDVETLSETLTKFSDLLTKVNVSVEELRKEYIYIIHGAPESFNTFKEIWDYVNVNGDPKSELIKLIESKQKAEEGKGLSTHDFSDLLYYKLTGLYTNEEIDEKFSIVVGRINAVEEKVMKLDSRSNAYASETDEPPKEVKDGDFWYQIITKDK